MEAYIRTYDVLWLMGLEGRQAAHRFRMFSVVSYIVIPTSDTRVGLVLYVMRKMVTDLSHGGVLFV